MLRHPIEGIAVIPRDENIGVWQIFVEGTKGSPFEGGIFELEMKFPEDYPDNPPTLYFVSEFWHPNVYDAFCVCFLVPAHRPAQLP